MNSRERFERRGNFVRNGSNRPSVVRQMVVGGFEPGIKRLAVMITEPLTPFRVVRGHTIGAGTSNEALRRARRHQMRFS